MKLARLTSFLQEISRFGTRNGFHSNFYSSTAKLSDSFVRPWNGRNTELFRRISPAGDPKVSIVPILDQWLKEGRSIDRKNLNYIVRDLRFHNRYIHALEISMWMTDKRYYSLTSSDVAIQLDLILKTQGIEEAEKYFDNVSQELKDHKVYSSLLNCYATAECVEKAEEVMQKMMGAGFKYQQLHYNVMLSLYYKTGNVEKFDTLLHEMEENGIACDKYTLAIRLNAYAVFKDVQGMDKIVELMESDPNIDWNAYATAATGYRKAGLIDKALEMLKKSEAIATTQRRCIAYNFLFSQYAAIGRKDEVLRLWSLYKQKEKVYNKGYLTVLDSLLKLDDIEMAVKIFGEWELQGLIYDMRIPNIIVGACCSKGLTEKAEALIDRVMSNGGKPNAWTWSNLAKGYLQKDQPEKAVELMKRAIAISEPLWKPSSEYLAACLEHLKGVGDMQEAREFIRSLMNKGIISVDVQENLMNAIKSEKPAQNGDML